MEDEIRIDKVFPLLQLPVGVETLLLPFVASGTGGLQSLLNLRQTCSTTKSWVDSLPPRQGKLVFSKSQVRMGSDVDTLQRFVETPPPSAVSALSLNINAILDKNPPAEEEVLWNSFCVIFAPHLENLQLRNEDDDDRDNADVFNGNTRIWNLVESPNLRVLRLADIFVLWNMSTSIPSSFYKVSELSINFAGGSRFPFEDDGHMPMDRFYSELKKNRNFRKLETFIHGVADYECFRNLIDAKKDDTRLKMNLHLKDRFPEDEDLENEDVKYLNFAEAVVASKSPIRLQMSSYHSLENALFFLPRHIALEMFKMVEFVEEWAPSEDTWALLESLPRLKQVEVIMGRYQLDCERLTFPPSLENLSFTSGFPLRPALPQALRSLTLHDFAYNATELANFLTLLKTQCAGLETLRITWNCCESSEALLPPAVNIEKIPGFLNLRSLTFKCRLKEKHLESCRAVLLCGFQVETLQLTHLALRLRFKSRDDAATLPVLTAAFLRGLCEGPVGNSLLMVDIQKESATPDGLPWLERLTSLASANAKNREEREGRGPWQRQWKFIK